MCISYFCSEPSLVPCVALSECLPPDMACAGVCPPGKSVCPTTNVCHEASLSESCDQTNETCLIGQTLVQQRSGSRYCANSSILSSIGATCTDTGFVYCEAVNECQNITSPLPCQPCPSGLFYCETNDSCIANKVECCGEGTYYCEVLGMCVEVGLRCELPNVAPVVNRQLVYLESLVNFDSNSLYSSQSHVISQLLGNGTYPAVDFQGEQVSIAVVQTSPTPANFGEWQYSLCEDGDFACLAVSSGWERIDGDLLSETNALALPNSARVRFVQKSIELTGAVWLRVKLWDGNEDGYLSPNDNLVALSLPQFLTTLPYTDRGAFSVNTKLLTILVHPYIQPPVFNSQASFQFTSILEDTTFPYNHGNTVSDIVTSVHVADLNPLREGAVHGLSSELEELLPLEARMNYLRDIQRVNSVRQQRQAARRSSQRPGVAISLNFTVPGRWQVSQSGDPGRFVSIRPLLDPSSQLLLLNTTARLRFLPDIDFCGDVRILFAAWDGFWKNSVATRLANGYIISHFPPSSSSLSHYNLNDWEEVWINVTCVPDKPVIREKRVLLDPIPYQIAYRYERLFTAMVARDFASVRRERNTLESYLQLILRVDVTIERIFKAVDDRLVRDIG